ncbi:MAG TPA: arylsulfatase [Sedimentisphaerales bacterium]|nr:arylsulfatase [Sedimentisphaerales bacterium]
MVRQTRREFLKTMGSATVSAGALSLSAGCAGARPNAAAESQRPNVVLVMTDDQGYGDFSCHGNPVLRTPNLDTLHGQSVRLTDFHVAPMCTPTRSQLMSGLDALRNRARHVCGGLDMLRQDVPTMADIFKASGYRTGLFGKWHLGDNYPYLPQYRGFEETVYHKSWGITSAGAYWGNDYFDDTYYHNGRLQKYDGYCNDVWFTEAMKWIKACAKQNERFFCYLPTNLPHSPLLVPEKYAAGYEQHGNAAKFFGMIANIDENMGKLMRMLEEVGIAENTILIFLTDNGGAGGVKVFNAGMRGGKRQLYDGGHRAACFIRWPKGGLQQGSDIDELTTCRDLFPTLIELCALTPPVGVTRLDGVSLASLLRGAEKTLSDRMIVVQYGIDISKWNSAVLWKKWRLVKGEELYNIGADPGQKQNVADKHPDIVKAMRDHYERWHSEVEPIANQPCYVHIGSKYENPTDLTCAQWYMLYADNFRDINGGNNSYWNVLVERDGRYEFTMSRYPLEADMAMDAPLTIRGYEVTALPVTKALMKIDRFEETKPVASGDKYVTFTVPLKAGKCRLQTWLYDKAGKELCGAYYVRANRLG